MPPRTAAVKATNRRTKNEALIAAAASGRDRLLYCLNWVASEARLLDGPGLDELIDHIHGVADTLNKTAAKGAARDRA